MFAFDGIENFGFKVLDDLTVLLRLLLIGPPSLKRLNGDCKHFASLPNFGIAPTKLTNSEFVRTKSAHHEFDAFHVSDFLLTDERKRFRHSVIL